MVYALGIVAGESPAKLGIEGGKNFWTLVPFTMQMVMIIIGGYVVASTPLVRRGIHWLAGVPKTPRGAVTLVALVATTSSLISWGLSPIISGFLVREMTGRVKGMDYRAAGTAAYLGTCSVWALGLSSSAAMLMATEIRTAAVAFRNQRIDSADANFIPVAKYRDGGGGDCGVGNGGVFFGAFG